MNDRVRLRFYPWEDTLAFLANRGIDQSDCINRALHWYAAMVIEMLPALTSYQWMLLLGHLKFIHFTTPHDLEIMRKYLMVALKNNTELAEKLSKWSDSTLIALFDASDRLCALPEGQRLFTSVIPKEKVIDG